MKDNKASIRVMEKLEWNLINLRHMNPEVKVLSGIGATTSLSQKINAIKTDAGNLMEYTLKFWNNKTSK